MGKKSKTPFRTTEQAAHFLVMSPKTLRNMRWRGEGPRYRKHGRLVVYHVDDLTDWSERRGILSKPKAG